jgi:predicted TIM-barrel fold metal-dependent hydrolase
VKGLGITGTVVVEASPWFENNQVAAQCRERKPAACRHRRTPRATGTTVKNHLQRFTRNPLFRGIRIDARRIAAGPPEPAFISNLQRLADQDLEFDALGENQMLADLVTLSDRVPDLRMVLNHLPFDPPVNGDKQNKTRKALRELGHPWIYAKVSGVLRRISGRVPMEPNFYRQPRDELWDTFGADRLVYGSNWPVSNQLASYDAVLHAVLDYFLTKGLEPAEKYFWKNSLAAYKWVNNSYYVIFDTSISGTGASFDLCIVRQEDSRPGGASPSSGAENLPPE